MEVIDIHVHLFPDDILGEYTKNYSAHSKMDFACSPTLDCLISEYKGINLRKCIILQEWESTVPFESENIQFMAESDKYYTKCYFYSYHKWLNKLQDENDNIICFGGVHPDDPNMLAEFDKMITEYNLKGLKLIPCMQHYFLNDRRLYPVYEKAEDLKLPMLFHTGGDPVPGKELYGHPRDVDEVASEFPDLIIIMAHMGVPFFDETKEILSKHRNVYADVSFTVDYEEVEKFSRRQEIDTSFLTREFWNNTLSSLIKDFGYEKILFGSDFPFVKPKNALDKFLSLDLSDEGKEMILSKNAKEILSIND